METEKKPLVSVIVPIYNMEEFLAETIHSIIETTYTPFELILVNDGSTDKSAKIAEEYVSKHPDKIKFFSQSNGGPSKARNLGIQNASGIYILPVDADNLISPDFIGNAVEILVKNPDVKVVNSEAVFFGEKEGIWKLPVFEISLLARKNLLDTCALYRRSDWEKAGGYCEEIPGREDWDFWISMLKRGGKVVRLPIIGLHYRVRSNSKRISDRKFKKETIDELNIRHKAFFYKYLRGKLRYSRTWSKFRNTISHIFYPEHVFVNTQYPQYDDIVYAANENEDIQNRFLHKISDKVEFTEFEEKIFHFPGLKMNRSKARTAYNQHNANKLGFYEQQVSLLTRKSYLITIRNV